MESYSQRAAEASFHILSGILSFSRTSTVAVLCDSPSTSGEPSCEPAGATRLFVGSGGGAGAAAAGAGGTGAAPAPAPASAVAPGAKSAKGDGAPAETTRVDAL
jgi:hypothetical protein